MSVKHFSLSLTVLFFGLFISYSEAAILTQDVSIILSDSDLNSRFDNVQKFDPSFGTLISVDWNYSIKTDYKALIEDRSSSDLYVSFEHTAIVVVSFSDAWFGGENYYNPLSMFYKTIPANSINLIDTTYTTNRNISLTSSALLDYVTGIGSYEWGFWVYAPQSIILSGEQIHWSASNFPACSGDICLIEQTQWVTQLTGEISYNYSVLGETIDVSEPSIVSLFSIGMLGLFLFRRTSYEIR